MRRARDNHFEDFKEGFGLKFIQDLELAYEYLRNHPRIGRFYKSNRRRFLLSRYPFGTFYAVEGGFYSSGALTALKT